jgi:AcrR family transcriptional regulator
MPTDAPPLGRRGAAVHEAVLAAALDELAAVGLDRASVAGVARRAGVHETSVYRRFGTREALFLEALLTSSEARVPVPDTGSLRGDLVETLRLLQRSAADPVGLAMLRSGAMRVTGEYAGERRRFWGARLRAFRTIFDRAIARGEVDGTIDVPLALELLVAPVYARLAVTGLDLDDDLPDRVVDLLLTGLLR